MKPKKKPDKITVKFSLVWVDPEGHRCDCCKDPIYLRQLSVMSACDIMGRPVRVSPSHTLARLCQSCGCAVEQNDDDVAF